MTTTHRNEILHQMKENGETWDDVEGCTMTDEELDREVRYEWQLVDVTAWTKNFVYFTNFEERGTWIDWVRRNPPVHT